MSEKETRKKYTDVLAFIILYIRRYIKSVLNTNFNILMAYYLLSHFSLFVKIHAVLSF